jgi:hypothetical protein
MQGGRRRGGKRKDVEGGRRKAEGAGRALLLLVTYLYTIYNC